MGRVHAVAPRRKGSPLGAHAVATAIIASGLSATVAIAASDHFFAGRLNASEGYASASAHWMYYTDGRTNHNNFASPVSRVLQGSPLDSS